MRLFTLPDHYIELQNIVDLRCSDVVYARNLVSEDWGVMTRKCASCKACFDKKAVITAKLENLKFRAK